MVAVPCLLFLWGLTVLFLLGSRFLLIAVVSRLDATFLAESILFLSSKQKDISSRIKPSPLPYHRPVL